MKTSRRKQLCDFEDDELLLGFKNSCSEVFTLLYSHYFSHLAVSAIKYVKSAEVAEEIVQEVFLKMWEHPFEIDNIKSLKPYLYRSVINASINYVSREKNISVHHQKIADNLSDAHWDSVYDEQELTLIIYNEIERLPEQCKKVFKLSRFECKTYREIALELNIGEKTVENHIIKALKTLRANLLLDGRKKENLSNIRYLMLTALLLSDHVTLTDNHNLHHLSLDGIPMPPW